MHNQFNINSYFNWILESGNSNDFNYFNKNSNCNQNSRIILFRILIIIRIIIILAGILIILIIIILIRILISYIYIFDFFTHSESFPVLNQFLCVASSTFARIAQFFDSRSNWIESLFRKHSESSEIHDGIFLFTLIRILIFMYLYFRSFHAFQKFPGFQLVFMRSRHVLRKLFNSRSIPNLHSVKIRFRDSRSDSNFDAFTSSMFSCMPKVFQSSV